MLESKEYLHVILEIRINPRLVRVRKPALFLKVAVPEVVAVARIDDLMKLCWQGSSYPFRPIFFATDWETETYS